MCDCFQVIIMDKATNSIDTSVCVYLIGAVVYDFLI